MPGQDAEFTAYVQRSRPRLLRAAYLLCGSWDLAEDVTQTTLAKLYLAWPRIEPERGPDGYAYRILARSMVDEHRRPWRRELLDAMLRPDPTKVSPR